MCAINVFKPTFYARVCGVCFFSVVKHPNGNFLVKSSRCLWLFGCLWLVTDAVVQTYLCKSVLGTFWFQNMLQFVSLSFLLDIVFSIIASIVTHFVLLKNSDTFLALLNQMIKLETTSCLLSPHSCHILNLINLTVSISLNLLLFLMVIFLMILNPLNMDDSFSPSMFMLLTEAVPVAYVCHFSSLAFLSGFFYLEMCQYLKRESDYIYSDIFKGKR